MSTTVVLPAVTTLPASFSTPDDTYIEFEILPDVPNSVVTALRVEMAGVATVLDPEAPIVIQAVLAFPDGNWPPLGATYPQLNLAASGPWSHTFVLDPTTFGGDYLRSRLVLDQGDGSSSLWMRGTFYGEGSLAIVSAAVIATIGPAPTGVASLRGQADYLNSQADTLDAIGNADLASAANHLRAEAVALDATAAEATA